MKQSKSIALVILLVAAAAGHAQITPTNDAYTDSSSPSANFGAKPSIEVVSPSETAYIKFDLSSIPAGYTSANVAKASLKLYVDSASRKGSFNVDLVNGPWMEKTITASLAPAVGSTIAASVPLRKANVHG